MKYLAYSFAPKSNKSLNLLPKKMEAENLSALAPQVIEEIERYELGTLDAILIYDDEKNFQARYSIQNYLDGDIPHKNNG
jgi:hypothetical protein